MPVATPRSRFKGVEGHHKVITIALVAEIFEIGGNAAMGAFEGPKRKYVAVGFGSYELIFGNELVEGKIVHRQMNSHPTRPPDELDRFVHFTPHVLDLTGAYRAGEGIRVDDHEGLEAEVLVRSRHSGHRQRQCE